MTSKELIQRTVAHKETPRIGWDFLAPYPSDIQFVGAAFWVRKSPYPDAYYSFDMHDEIKAMVPQFGGEVKLDDFGNVYGRLNGMTKGECIKGFLDDWEKLSSFHLPQIDTGHPERLAAEIAGIDKYVIAGLPLSIFSNLRDVRLMDNALMDTLIEQEYVRAFLDLILERMEEICASIAGKGVNAVMLADDWGVQDRTFIGPDTFCALFKPAYKRLCDAAHNAGLRVVMHSCGYNYAFIPHLIEAGIDVFQFDQPSVYPEECLAREFGARAAFYLPVDIQKTMPTGDRKLIEESAIHMVTVFKDACRGSLIAKDYPAWGDIGVKDEWAAWARDVILQHSAF